MDRINTFRAPGEAEQAEPSDETVINGAPYGGHHVTQSGGESPVTSIDRPDAAIAEEIKRRQVSLGVRYVAALRARQGRYS